VGRPSSLFVGGEALVAGLDPPERLEYAGLICIPCMVTYASCGREGGSSHANDLSCMSTLLSTRHVRVRCTKPGVVNT
jgi:hypothetical protein